MKFVSIVGARPQFIKAAAVSRAMGRISNGHSHGLRHVLVHTGQHYDQNMSEVFFAEMEIPQPDYNLGIGSGPHGQQTGRMLEAIEQVLIKERPQVCIVYGDTNSTLAGALAAAKLHIPVAHVEAGLRSFDRRMPEEVNRVLTDHVANLLFCPTQTAVQNLAREGMAAGVHLVGDVMYDCIRFYLDKVGSQADQILKRFSVRPGRYLLATIHRAENTDDKARLGSVLEALDSLSADIPVLLPIHPRTAGYMRQYGLAVGGQVQLTEPVSYLTMLTLVANARLILTDSGGVQKEAYWLKVPCVTLRDRTEWVETVSEGWNTLAGADTARIMQAVQEALKPQARPDPIGYGRADAAERICSTILGFAKDLYG